jgi:hypothetical protein
MLFPERDGETRDPTALARSLLRSRTYFRKAAPERPGPGSYGKYVGC